jgi:hypothetical protein
VKLALRPVDVKALRTDGGTQVRESLNEEWIAELQGLYEDGGHDLPPISVVEDGDTFWVFDGHHRVEALRRLNWGSATCAIRCQGTLDDAKYFASAANKHGLPRNAGDKKRAVLLALATPEGRKMGLRELSRHCGVALSYTSRIVGGEGVFPREHQPHRGQQQAASKSLSPRQLLWARIDAALQTDPGNPDANIAKDIGCHTDTVRARRKVLGLSKSDPTRWKECPTRDAAEALLKDHPEWSNRQIAEKSGSSPETVSRLRIKAGAPAPRRDSAPSAPPRKLGDARAAAQVIQLRPPPGVSTTVTEALRIVDRMTDTERDAFADACASKWPTVFGGQRNGKAGGA